MLPMPMLMLAKIVNVRYGPGWATHLQETRLMRPTNKPRCEYCASIGNPDENCRNCGAPRRG